MISRQQGTAGSPTNAADFYDLTRSLLIEARAKRDLALMRRCKIRVDSERFKALSDSRQEELLELYGAAMMATGAGAP